jgi:probable rRNA maturation factor
VTLPLEAPRIEQLVAATIAAVQVPEGHVDIGVQFVDVQHILRLNRDHRHVDAATDVLSFPIDGLEELEPGLPRQLGDVVICPAYVEEQVAGRLQMHHTDETVDAALERCIVHGVLHLCGYDHERSKDDAAQMYQLEQQVLDA